MKKKLSKLSLIASSLALAWCGLGSTVLLADDPPVANPAPPSGDSSLQGNGSASDSTAKPKKKRKRKKKKKAEANPPPASPGPASP
jgi:hypothetical protein